MVFRYLLKKYTWGLKNYPATTKITSGAIMVGFGDFLAQKFIENKTLGPDGTYNIRRTIRFSLIALLMVTPSTRYWVDVILPKFINNKNSASLNKIAIKKAVADTFLFAPYILSLIFFSNSYFEKYDYKENSKLRKQKEPNVNKILENLKDKVPLIIINSWCWWPWHQFINFRFVPFIWQASYIQVIALFWNTFLSWKLHQLMKDDGDDSKNQ